MSPSRTPSDRNTVAAPDRGSFMTATRRSNAVKPAVPDSGELSSANWARGDNGGSSSVMLSGWQ